MQISSSHLSIFCCLLSLFVGGCGGGTYEAQYETARGNVTKAAPFNQLEREPRSFEGSNDTVRLPKSPSSDQKWTAYNSESKDPGDPSIPIEAHVLRPPMLADRDEMSVLFEAWGKYDIQGIPFELPVCAYLGAFDGKTIAPKDLETLVSARFIEGHGPQAALPTVGNWEEVVVKSPPAPDGTQRDLVWRRLTASGPSKLERKSQSAETKWGDYPVTYEAWLYAPPRPNPEAVFLVVWRVPTEVQAATPGERGKFALAALAPLTAGTLEVGAPSEPAPATN